MSNKLFVAQGDYKINFPRGGIDELATQGVEACVAVATYSPKGVGSLAHFSAIAVGPEEIERRKDYLRWLKLSEPEVVALIGGRIGQSEELIGMIEDSLRYAGRGPLIVRNLFGELLRNVALSLDGTLTIEYYRRIRTPAWFENVIVSTATIPLNLEGNPEIIKHTTAAVKSAERT